MEEKLKTDFSNLSDNVGYPKESGAGRPVLCRLYLPAKTPKWQSIQPAAQ